MRDRVKRTENSKKIRQLDSQTKREIGGGNGEDDVEREREREREICKCGGVGATVAPSRNIYSLTLAHSHFPLWFRTAKGREY